MKNKSNTKDFGSLFITNTAEKKEYFHNSNDEVIKEIDPLDCINWKYADRQNFEMGDLHELASNISENGQVQPIVVREVNDKYEVIAGERRWRACSLINKKVKAVIKNLTDEDAFILQAAENIKQELSHYSQSVSYHKILSEEKISQRTLAKRLGMSKSSLSNLLSFSSIPSELWEAVGDMRKVTIKTACFIKQLLDSDPNVLVELLSIASEIQKGAGSSKIKKLLEKENKEISKNVYSSKNKILFKVDHNKIVLPTIGLDSESLKKLVEHLKNYLEVI
ncbi:ParB/RepB/Spo0J family partition protein [Legionella sp. PATHC038]|uniref:ParB/RepB/Spo0J family partition protein n=1 Tax=Legionella sheltonii TaxID=2992041 RepID=UPI001A227FA7|nr:ParB/RepB/Spo0J family partition protein [Legionella sp. PATHC038]MCW8400496.1 ParB/RepB/Spo0J family partition protein [Legionella sp. PATHC038]HAT7841150.1 ParB/RepB/Spo0J family partition protein [Legionella pneumophila]